MLPLLIIVHGRYQLALLTPGKFPAMASILKLNCAVSTMHTNRRAFTYSCHFKIAQDTSTLTAHDTSIADLCRPRVAVHLRQLQLGLGADSRCQGRVADNVAKSLPSVNS